MTPSRRVLTMFEESRLPKGQCSYQKPHPSHTWQTGGENIEERDRYCTGVQDPNCPMGDSGLITHSKQALGEWELWREWSGVVVIGKQHLHFLFLRGDWNWVVRSHKSPLCGTPRCKRVWISNLDKDSL